MSNITLMAPEQLAALVDEQTERLLGHNVYGKRSPTPRLRATSPRKLRRTKPAAIPPDTINHIYVLQVPCGKEISTAKGVSQRCPVSVRLLSPANTSRTLWPSGYVYLGTDHSLSAEEAKEIGRLRLGYLNPRELPAWQREKLLDHVQQPLAKRLERLLDRIPEIANGTSKIIKIAVTPDLSVALAIDGPIQPIVRHMPTIQPLFRERIHLLAYSPDPYTFLRRALAPIPVRRVEVVPNSLARVWVPAEEHQKIVGLRRVHVRLAEALTGCRIKFNSL